MGDQRRVYNSVQWGDRYEHIQHDYFSVDYTTNKRGGLGYCSKLEWFNCSQHALSVASVLHTLSTENRRRDRNVERGRWLWWKRTYRFDNAL